MASKKAKNVEKGTKKVVKRIKSSKFFKTPKGRRTGIETNATVRDYDQLKLAERRKKYGKKRGRPFGSKNKPKIGAVVATSTPKEFKRGKKFMLKPATPLSSVKDYDARTRLPVLVSEVRDLDETIKEILAENDESLKEIQAQRAELTTEIQKIVVKAKLDPIVDTAHKAHKMLTSLRKELLDPITDAKGIVSGKLLEYEEAAKAAAEQEAAALAAQERHAEEERRLALACEAEQDGRILDANAILNEAPAEVVVHVDAEVAAVEGVGKTYEIWSAEVTDFAALAQSAVASQQASAYLLPNMVALNAMARAMKGNLRIPGVKAVCKQTRAVRG